jgi:hypothetical protein
MRATLALLSFVAPLLSAAGAWGQAPAGEDESRLELMTAHGMSLALGAGAMGFLGREARDLMGGDALGFYADLRGAYGTRSRFGGELAFTRAGRSPTRDERRGGDSAIFGQSFEGLLRVNHPSHTGRLFHAPFAVAGLGWTDFRPEDDREPSTRARRIDRVGIIPLGLGLAASYRALYGEARVVYRPTFGENGLGAGAGSGPSMQAWFAGLALGVEL